MGKIPCFQMDKYHTYEELKQILHSLADAMPELCKLKVIGTTHQGRDIIALEITDYNTGIPAEKTGFYVDACTHAEEVCGTNAALYVCKYLLENFDQRDDVRQLLENTIFYVIPRLNPDGIEMALQGNAWVGNGRYLPGEIQPNEGLYATDIDGDGIVTQMRVEDPDGEWRVSEKDPRLMVLRKPYETGGKYYRLYPEGYIRGEVVGFPIPKPRDGNLNRNYPGLWTPEGMQYGACELPLCEPETRAVADYIVAHPNICGVQAFHTNAGVILRPFGHQGDQHYKGRDKDIYLMLGKMGTEELGYPVISVYEEFTSDDGNIRGGTLTDWTYLMLGIPGITTELWNVNEASQNGIKSLYPPANIGEEADLKLLAWADEKLDGHAYIDWKEYDHPQLGKVEVGGWNRVWVFRNPPPCLLEEQSYHAAMFTIKLAQALPKVIIRDAYIQHLSEDVYKVGAIVKNMGYLPTYLTSQAISVNEAPALKLKLEGNGCDIDIACASDPLDIGHLQGRFGRDAEWSPFRPKWDPVEKKVEWIIRTDCKNPSVTITVENPRVGVVRETVTL